ncbi:MAG: hypothetical protein K2X38_02745 [Gemmataceae bacterium]|nr:hypothetical protein [Gemmataceae bacterium]
MRFTIFWRWLLLASYAFWLGGFVFYAAVVVPIGTDVLESRVEQGFITRRVSYWINISGAIALALFAIDLLMPPRRMRWGLLPLWISMAIAQAVLMWMHPRIDVYMDLETHRVLERSVFRPMHKIYLWIHTVQWLVGCVYLALLLRRWSIDDSTNARTAEI